MRNAEQRRLTARDTASIKSNSRKSKAALGTGGRFLHSFYRLSKRYIPE